MKPAKIIQLCHSKLPLGYKLRELSPADNPRRHPRGNYLTVTWLQWLLLLLLLPLLLQMLILTSSQGMRLREALGQHQELDMSESEGSYRLLLSHGAHLCDQVPLKNFSLCWPTRWQLWQKSFLGQTSNFNRRRTLSEHLIWQC
jgi:hypothetical protein